MRMAQIGFELFAPTVTGARLLGEWNDWEPLDMERGDDGAWRVAAELPDGCHRYRFAVRTKSWFFEEDAWVELVDPRATALDATSENAVARIEGGERLLDRYAWRHDGAELPPDDALTIYEMHIGDFSGGEADPHARGRFEHVVEKLDYLQELGVNALELMPVWGYPGEFSWGYNPRHPFAVEPTYGSSEDLKRLIDEAHGHGMRVLLDVVLNHAESEAPLTRIDHDYWFHHEPPDPDNSWGPSYNYEHRDEALDLYPARAFAEAVVRHWVREYHIDGLRFDAAKQMDNYDAMAALVAAAKDEAGPKPFYCVAEHIPETPEIVGVDGPMDACWHQGFYWTLQDLLCGREPDLEAVKDALDGRRRGFAGASSLVNFLTNHDHDHLLAELAACGHFDEEAFRRVELGAALLFTALGVPLVWMGEEFGEFKHKRTDPNKIDWTLLEGEPNRRLHAVYRGLARLRAEQGALRSENLEVLHEDPERRLLAWQRWDDAGSRVVTVANLSGDHLGEVELDGWPEDGPWHEWLRDFAVEAAGGRVRLELPPFEARVLVKR